MKRYFRTVAPAMAWLLAAMPAWSAQTVSSLNFPACFVQGRPEKAARSARTPSWPNLPTCFVNGRPATVQDMRAGRALFMLPPKDRSGQAASVRVPQYALWRDAQGTERHTVVLQAEKSRDGEESLALLRTDGEIDIVPRAQVTLLGSNKSNQ